jgi:hypothetical protein
VIRARLERDDQARLLGCLRLVNRLIVTLMTMCSSTPKLAKKRRRAGA